MICVLGDPRTFTSLTMRVLAAGGVPVKTTSRFKGPINPHGVYEDNDSNNDTTRLRHVRGEFIAVKVFPRQMLWLLLPRTRRRGGCGAAIIPAHVLRTKRPIEATLASWDECFPDREHVAGMTRADVGVVIERAVMVLHQAHVQILDIDGDRLIDNPREVCEEIVAFLGRDLDVAAMSAVPDPSLRHFGAHVARNAS